MRTIARSGESMPSNRRPNMRDVAAAAGVNQATVSRALRNDARISEARRQAIRAVAERMGYRPHPLYAALGEARRRRLDGMYRATLGFVTNSSRPVAEAEPEDYVRQLFEGATAAAAAQGYGLEEFWLGAAGMTPARLNRILLARGVPGLILAPLPMSGARGSYTLQWSEFSTVTIGLSFESPVFDRVVPDLYRGVLLALDAIRLRQFQRPGLCVRVVEDDRAQGRLLAPYLHVLNNGTVKGAPALVLKAWNPAAFRRWSRNEAVDAVLTTSTLAPYVRKALETDGRGQVGLCTLNVTNGSAFAGVDQQRRLLGRAAAQLAIEKLNRNERGIPEIPFVTQVPVVWRDGPSLTPRARAAAAKT